MNYQTKIMKPATDNEVRFTAETNPDGTVTIRLNGKDIKTIHPEDRENEKEIAS